MKKPLLVLPMLLCMTAAGGSAEQGFDHEDRQLLALHLGYAHPLSGALLVPSRPSATQEARQ